MAMKTLVVALLMGLLLGGVAQGADSPEDIIWASVKKSDALDEYRIYVEQYPKGKYSEEAWRRIGQLESEEMSALARRQERERQREEDEIARKEEERRRVQAQVLRPGQVVKDCPECPEMVVIPAGSFEMGSNSSHRWATNERPIHIVNVSMPFALGVTEVTQKQWQKVMGSNPSYYSGCGEDCPVENVSWNDVKEYLRKLSEMTGKTYRLPSEAEWEYACLAGKKEEYCGSNILDNVGGADPGISFLWSTNKPVKSKRANAWGLFDMSGSVYEMVEDCWHDSYEGAPSDSTPWIDAICDRRVIRGGFWGGQPFSARSRARASESEPSIKFTLPRKFLGFRSARAL